jgi:DNA-binding IclR family transcriptional regulator
MATGERVAASAEHRTVARVMSILELVLASESRGLRLGDLSSAIDAPKSSVHILVKGLVAEGYLRVEDNRYLPGPATASLLAVGSTSAAAPYRHTLEQLSRQWNETAIVATLVGDSLVYIDSVESEEFIRAAPQLHRRFELWPRSSGRCLLAFMDGRRLDSYLDRHHSREEGEFIRAALHTVRETRIGINGLEADSAHLGIATPVITGPGPVTVSITVAGPKSRMADKIDDIAASMLRAVEKLSRRSVPD